MVIGDITREIKDNLQFLSYGGGVYSLSYPAYYEDGAQITIAVKLEHETEVVLEREEEAESEALLSTSDEYTIMDLGSVAEKFGNIEGIDTIIKRACDRYRVQYDGQFITLNADVATTCQKINRFVKCIFEIELRANEIKQYMEIVGKGTTEELMEYINHKSE